MNPSRAAELPFGTDIQYQGRIGWFVNYKHDCLISVDGEMLFVEAEEIEELRSDSNQAAEGAAQQMLVLWPTDNKG